MTLHARAFEDLDELPPETVLLGGKLVIDIRIGRGAAATVYAATTSDGQQVALKVLAGEHAHNRVARQRFSNEVALAQHLAGHPRVAAPYEMGELPELGGRPYMTMPLVKGRSLVQLLGRLDLADAVALMRDLAQVVEDVHACGVIHRDIKPANVIVQQAGNTGVPYLLDFGIAYSRGEGTAPATAGLTADHELPGTKHYMAPEQLMGACPDPRTDVYALGVTMYELLTGVTPLDDLSPAAAAQRKCDPSLPALSIAGRVHDVPKALEQTIDAALERDPELRLPSAAAVVEQLTAVLDTLVGALPTSTQVTEPAPQAVPIPAETVCLPRHAAADAVHEVRMRKRARGAAPSRFESFVSPPPASGILSPPEPPKLNDTPPEENRRGARRIIVGAIVLTGLLLMLLGLGVVLRWVSPSASEAREESVNALEPSDPGPHERGVPPREDAPSEEPPTRALAALEEEGDPTGSEPALGPESEEPPSADIPEDPDPPPAPAMKRGSPPRPVCPDVASQARAASGERQWKRVIELTASGPCWKSRSDRVALRVEALLELGRFRECAAQGRGHSASEVARMAATCQKHLDKESAP